MRRGFMSVLTSARSGGSMLSGSMLSGSVFGGPVLTGPMLAGICALTAFCTLADGFATHASARAEAGAPAFDLPAPEIGRLTPEMLEAARVPTGRESSEPPTSCIVTESPTARAGDWCPSIFNQIDTAHYARGTTLIWHILVDHAGGSFEQDEIDLVGSRAALAKQYFRDYAPNNAWIRFDHEDASGFYYYNPTLPYEIDFEDGDDVDDDWVNDACIALGVPDSNGDGYYTDDLSLGLQSWLGWDNVIVVFQVADIWFRANASVSRGACQVPPFEAWQVYAHEWGHCFGACDEYEENGGCNGNDCNWICQSCYIDDDVPNGNCEVGPCPTQTCVMYGHMSGGLVAPCPYTVRNWAWVDADANSLLDNTVWNRSGSEETLWELFHQGWLISTNTNWGFAASQTSPSWGAVGVRARDASTCYGIDVYGDNNFRWHLAESDLNTRVNFVVGDFNHNNLGRDHVRVNRKFGSAQYLLNYENGSQMLYADGVDRNKTWLEREVVRTYDVPLFAGESVRFDLDIQTAGLDLGMALFRSNGAVYYAGRGDAVASAASGGPGVSEVFVYDVPADDVYGLVVFANTEIDGNWAIQVGPNSGQLFDETPVLSSLDLGLYYYNATDPYWSVVATRPHPGKNVRLRLFAESNYQTLLATSGAYPGVEFIAADYHPSQSVDYVRVNAQSGGGQQDTEWEQSQDILDGFDLVGFTQHQVAKVWDCYLRAGQRYFFRDWESGVDTGIYLMSSADGNRYIQRSGAETGNNGSVPGDGNSFFYTAPASDWYGFVAIKDDESAGSITVLNGAYYELAERSPVTAPESMILAEFPEESSWVVVGARVGAGALGQSGVWDCDDYHADCLVDYTSDQRDVTFVAIDANHIAGPGGNFYYHYQLMSGSGGGTVSFDDAGGQSLVYIPSDLVVGEDEFSANEVVHVWQLDVLAGGGGTDVQVLVNPLDPGLDVGVALLSSADGSYILDSDDENGPTNEAATGEREILTATISDTDTYAIVVTNHNGAAGRYEIVVGESGATSDVSPDTLPATFDFRLVGANPTSEASTFQLALPEASPVESRVYDVRGRMVRSLQTGSLRAGHHDLRWDGQDDRGRDVGSGVYFVRTVAGAHQWNLKVLRAQ